ncbi:hypothetical protein POSPLADRAFT_1161999, partial [Postia placenta MAD-698-R-SB12]
NLQAVKAGRYRVIVINPEIIMQDGHTKEIIQSNDRPKISLCVRKMEHAASSFKDLDFVIPDDFATNVSPPKFVIFCNSILETEAITQYLCNWLPDHLRTKIKYLHTTMSADYRADEYMALKNGDLFGLCVTDAFGMGFDLAGIQLVIQWKAPLSINTLWQHFGRAARGTGEFVFAILIAERHNFDEEMRKKEVAKAKRQERAGKKRKRKETMHTTQPFSCIQSMSNR